MLIYVFILSFIHSCIRLFILFARFVDISIM